LSNSPESERPKPTTGVDIRKLQIGPEEAFVLSRVDGFSTVREIGYATSLPEAVVERCLRRLSELGAIAYSEPKAQPKPDRQVATPRPETAAPISPAPDLATARQREISELYDHLGDFDHYQLLGVPRDADKRAVKAAYYEKVKVFHPDRYFGKDLGALRAKLEQCFAQLTVAHDTLSVTSRREEYDEYLREQQRSAALERALSTGVTIQELEHIEEKLDAELNVQASLGLLASTPRLSALESASTTTAPAVIELGVSQADASPRMSDDERLQFLARKLRVSSASLRAPPRASAPSAPITPPPASREQVADHLRRQLGASRIEERRGQVASQLAAADTAMARNDPVAAANALRVAQSLSPQDATIAERLAQTQAMAAMTLADTYLRQAEYEERSGRFEAAARTYERAARSKPSPQAWESAARCLLESGGDLRLAGEYAKQSITLDAERATSHLILARIFLSAQMRSSAVAELERARRIDPNNDTVLSLLKRVANDEI
jgi:curved DNA-binding protein CbpA